MQWDMYGLHVLGFIPVKTSDLECYSQEGMGTIGI